MIILLFIIHVLVAIALVGVVLLQKSEGGALGIGGSGGGMSGFLTGRSTANLLTRTTAILGALFFLLSIALVKFGTYGGAPVSLIGPGPVPASSAPAPSAPAGTNPAVPSPAAPAQPAPAPPSR